MYYAGIDVGGTSVKLGVMDDAGELVFQGAVDTIREDARALCQRIVDALFKTGLPLRAAGVSCAGRVNLKTRLVIASNLRWRDVPFADMLEKALGCPVAIDNDVAGALMGEWKRGACKNEKNVLYITLGTGVGGAFLVEGKPFRGHDNTGGEIGHMITHGDGRLCACGGHGCFEQYASATALSRMAGGLEVPEIFARAAAGDAQMDGVLDQYAHELVIGIASLTGLMRPEVVVLGGGVSNAGEALLTRVREQLYEHCPCMPNQEKPRVTVAALGNTAGVIGAGMMAMELYTRQEGKK